jgi:polyhydroxyalkanoate synthesis regulator phasin
MSLDEAATVLDDLLPMLTEVAAATDIPTTTCNQIERLTETLVTTVHRHADRFDALEAENDDLKSTVTTIQTRLDESTAQIETLESQLAELEAELRKERETRAKADAEDRKRIHEVETQVEEATDDDTTVASTDPDAESATTATDPGVQPPETPLEDIVRIPEHLVKDSLTANQQRARFVAKDVHEYTQRVPAGRAIKSSALRRVLTASEDTTIYTQTVSRVIDFLDELGDDAVKVRESKQGERVIVFTEAFVERVQQYRRRDAGSNTVVTPTGAGG